VVYQNSQSFSVPFVITLQDSECFLEGATKAEDSPCSKVIGMLCCGMVGDMLISCTWFNVLLIMYLSRTCISNTCLLLFTLLTLQCLIHQIASEKLKITSGVCVPLCYWTTFCFLVCTASHEKQFCTPISMSCENKEYNDVACNMADDYLLLWTYLTLHLTLNVEPWQLI
jgi:hypothetical protein